MVHATLSAAILKQATVRYLKATGVGIVVALLFAVVWGWGALQIPIWWQMWQQRHEGGGAAGATVGSDSILLAALVGFVVGFSWIVRRTSRPRDARESRSHDLD